MSGSLLFCTHGSQKSGIGHLMRCQALAQAAAEQCITSWFMTNAEAQPLIEQRHFWTGRVIRAASQEIDLAKQIQETAARYSSIAIIIDGYDFSESLLQEVANSSVPLVLLDDILQPGYQYADIICNPAGGHLRDKYVGANPDAMLCLGSQYRLLRREFSSVEPLPLSARKSLTISMGGSDPAGLTLPILSKLTEVLPDAPFRVITGPGYEDAALLALKNFMANSECAIQHIHNCQDMTDVWNNARLAVVAAGGSQFELVACHTPAVLICMAENQRSASEQAMQQGWCRVSEVQDDINMDDFAVQIEALWREENALTDMQQNAGSHAVIDGADQLLTAIFKKHMQLAGV